MIQRESETTDNKKANMAEGNEKKNDFCPEQKQTNYEITNV